MTTRPNNTTFRCCSVRRRLLLAAAALPLGTTALSPAAGPDESDCCYDHPMPGCSDKTCTALVCGADPFCCEVSWDGICAAAAQEMCAVCSGDDVTAPVLTLPADIVIECGVSSDPSLTGFATAVDDYDPDPWISYSDAVHAGQCPGDSSIIRTWSATDFSGNIASGDQLISMPCDFYGEWDPDGPPPPETAQWGDDLNELVRNETGAPKTDFHIVLKGKKLGGQQRAWHADAQDNLVNGLVRIGVLGNL